MQAKQNPKHTNIKDFLQTNIHDTSKQPPPFIDHLLGKLDEHIAKK
jgi:hypothetical protein